MRKKVKAKGLENKKYVRVFQTTRHADLKLSQLLVYSYRVYQLAEDGSTPSVHKVCKATGLAKRTVTSADTVLTAKGLLTAGLLPIEPPVGLFVDRDEKSDIHWRYNYAYWDCYTHQPGNTVIDHIDVAVWSFLVHLCFSSNGYVPPQGYTASYFAVVLGCQRQTAERSLQHLAEKKIIRRMGRHIELILPSEEMMAALQNVRNTNKVVVVVGTSDNQIVSTTATTPTVNDIPIDWSTASTIQNEEATLDDIMKYIVVKYPNDTAEEMEIKAQRILAKKVTLELVLESTTIAKEQQKALAKALHNAI